VRAESELRDAGLSEFAQWYREAGSERPERPAAELARAAIAKAMADAAFSQHRGSLEGYSGEDFDRIRQTIAQRDRELVRLSQDVIRNTLLHSARPPAGNGIGRKSSFKDMALINNELAKKKLRVGVRELTQRAGRALVELKPCWMMSPLAVAQYLHSGLSFDLLVVDEASQMTPENAVGALRRVNQAIVVGDTKQLPPTMFFNKVMQGEETDEDLQEDSESVLDLANAAFSPIRRA
jgi:superfamily I DNA and/or RNA helicase